MRNFTSVLMNTDKIFFESESSKEIIMKDNMILDNMKDTMILAHSDTATLQKWDVYWHAIFHLFSSM